MVRVKICGVTRPEDVRLIAREGADAIGFQMSLGPRKITPAQAKRLVKQVPPFVTPVGVFVDEPLAKLKALIKYCGFQAVQLHGDEKADFAQALGLPVIKALRMKNANSPRLYRDFRVAAFLLDRYNKDKRGGTGETFDWKWARQASASLPAPVLLAGGLTPENVVKAVQTARPFGVDVASGVEILPGRKDPRKVSQFIRRAKKAVQA
ncbi:MAG TPA: phosphoribosylanthranilate isomerase [bacterium]|nr:phosphoribosylanthranilate isomerase [bacterium]